MSVLMAIMRITITLFETEVHRKCTLLIHKPYLLVLFTYLFFFLLKPKQNKIYNPWVFAL